MSCKITREIDPALPNLLTQLLGQYPDIDPIIVFKDWTVQGISPTESQIYANLK
jgi:hypothetical protein